MLAALLGWGQATFASKIVAEDGRVAVTREVDGGLETVVLAPPAIVTTDLRLNEPRYVTLPNIRRLRAERLAGRPDRQGVGGASCTSQWAFRARSSTWRA